MRLVTLASLTKKWKNTVKNWEQCTNLNSIGECMYMISNDVCFYNHGDIPSKPTKTDVKRKNAKIRKDNIVVEKLKPITIVAGKEKFQLLKCTRCSLVFSDKYFSLDHKCNPSKKNLVRDVAEFKQEVVFRDMQNRDHFFILREASGNFEVKLYGDCRKRLVKGRGGDFIAKIKYKSHDMGKEFVLRRKDFLKKLENNELVSV